MAVKDKLLSSAYDGIQEYDNDLPRWWVWLFYGTIIFGAIYSGYYYLGFGSTQRQQLAADLAEIRSLAPKVTAMGESELLALTTNSAALAKGKEIFVGKCAACHLADGGGLVGPNLTDDYWIHGGKITDIHRTITEGVVEKGMLSWKSMLSAEEIGDVAAYVWNLHGTTPAAPKAPQGDLVTR